MKTKNFKAVSSLRFRRWSRAGYAIFCSLARTVTIGSVVASISDKSLQKAVGITKSSLFPVASETESRDRLKELSDLEATLHNILETSLLNISFDSATACYQFSSIF